MRQPSLSYKTGPPSAPLCRYAGSEGDTLAARLDLPEGEPQAYGGEFANTTFSSNAQDLVRAAAFSRDHSQAPRILIGHSLGGAAVQIGGRPFRIRRQFLDDVNQQHLSDAIATLRKALLVLHAPATSSSILTTLDGSSKAPSIPRA